MLIISKKFCILELGQCWRGKALRLKDCLLEALKQFGRRALIITVTNMKISAETQKCTEEKINHKDLEGQRKEGVRQR
jgi:hypothetical protein